MIAQQICQSAAWFSVLWHANFASTTRGKVVLHVLAVRLRVFPCLNGYAVEPASSSKRGNRRQQQSSALLNACPGGDCGRDRKKESDK